MTGCFQGSRRRGCPDAGVPGILFHARTAKFIGYKAPIALRIANDIMERQIGLPMEEAIEVELGRLKDIFSTDDALLGLSNIGRRVEFKGA